MKTAKELYPDTFETKYDCTGDYNPILGEFGNILYKKYLSLYQGDALVFYEQNGRYGWLSFGYGSCSGCDALQACESHEEVDTLMRELSDRVEWFESLDAIKERFRTKDWGLEYYSQEEGFDEFIDFVLNYENA